MPHILIVFHVSTNVYLFFTRNFYIVTYSTMDTSYPTLQEKEYVNLSFRLIPIILLNPRMKKDDHNLLFLDDALWDSLCSIEICNFSMRKYVDCYIFVVVVIYFINNSPSNNH